MSIAHSKYSFEEKEGYQIKPGENWPVAGDFMLPLGVPPWEGGSVMGDGLGGAFVASTRIGLSVRTPNSLRTGEISGFP